MHRTSWRVLCSHAWTARARRSIAAQAREEGEGKAQPIISDGRFASPCAVRGHQQDHCHQRPGLQGMPALCRMQCCVQLWAWVQVTMAEMVNSIISESAWGHTSPSRAKSGNLSGACCEQCTAWMCLVTVYCAAGWAACSEHLHPTPPQHDAVTYAEALEDLDTALYRAEKVRRVLILY